MNEELTTPSPSESPTDELTPTPTPIVIVAEGENEQYYVQTCENINNFIDKVTPTVNIATGFIQFLMVLIGVVAFYKLLKIFF